MLDEDRLSRRKSIVDTVSIQVDILSGNGSEDKVWKPDYFKAASWVEGGGNASEVFPGSWISGYSNNVEYLEGVVF